MRKNRRRFLVSLFSLLLCICLVPFPAASAAEGDPTLQFDLSTSGRTEGLKPGDQVTVTVTVSRQDETAEPYHLASLMLDIQYDNQLLEVSQMKTSGLKRPDGQQWIGGWSCNEIEAGLGTKRIRVLYLNMAGLMQDPPNLDLISGKIEAASFVLTVKKEPEVKTDTKVEFYFTENGDAYGNLSPSVIGSELMLSLSGSSHQQGGDSNNSGSTGSGSSGTSGSSGSGGGASGSNQPAPENQKPDTNEEAKTETSGETAAVSFAELTDIGEDHWAAPYVKVLVEKGVLSGNEKKEFQPEKPVTRAEFCQMISSAFGYKGTDDAVFFSDVTQEDWFFEPVMALYRAGVTAGVGDGRFGAEETLLRQDMAVILSRVLQDNNIIRKAERTYAEFSDQAQVADYARQALTDLYCTGLISGTSETTLSPKAETTRAQAAVVLYNMLEKQEER